MNERPVSTKQSLSHSPDLFIAGAGPAGLACGIAAALRGLSVEVADAMRPPIDKPCGEGLMPDSLADLTVLGVDPTALQHAPLHGVRFLGESGTTEADFPTGHGRGIRRNLLHQLLLDRASALGVRFHWQTVVQSLISGPDTGLVRTNRHCSRPRWIVAADGHQSRLRVAAGLDRGHTSSRRIGLQQHFTLDLWTNHVEIYWSEHGQAYITPVSPNEVCIIFLGHRKFPSLEATLALYPTLARRLVLAHATANGPTRGAFTLNRTLNRVTAGNLALIGDASGSVDAVTGEGLALCFRQAKALADALIRNNLPEYQTAHRRIARLPTLMSRTMLLLDRSPLLRHHALATLSRRPALFGDLLALHLGQRSLRTLGSMSGHLFA